MWGALPDDVVLSLADAHGRIAGVFLAWGTASEATTASLVDYVRSQIQEVAVPGDDGEAPVARPDPVRTTSGRDRRRRPAASTGPPPCQTGRMGFMDKVRETAGDVVASAQDGLTKGQVKLDQYQHRKDAEELFKVLGQAYWVHHRGNAGLEQVEALAVGLDDRMAPIEAQLGPVPFPPMPPVAPGPPTAPPPPGPDPAAPPA